MSDLFTFARANTYPDTPGYKEGATSRVAAKAIQPVAGSLRIDALAEIKSAPGGLTADQVAYRLHRSVLSIRPRIAELNRMGLIRQTGERRQNASGLSAHVWGAV